MLNFQLEVGASTLAFLLHTGRNSLLERSDIRTCPELGVALRVIPGAFVSLSSCWHPRPWFRCSPVLVLVLFLNKGSDIILVSCVYVGYLSLRRGYLVADVVEFKILASYVLRTAKLVWRRNCALKQRKLIVCIVFKNRLPWFGFRCFLLAISF